MSRRLRLFPLNAVLFPGAVLNLHVFEPRYKQLIAECLESGEGFGVALIAEGAEAGDPNVLPHDIGSIAEIVDVQPLPFGRYFISTVGRNRFRIRDVISREPYLIAEVDELEEPVPYHDREVDELLPAVRELFDEYNAMLVEFSGQESVINLPPDPQGTSYLIGDMLQVATRVKQRLLELSDTKARLRAEHDFLERLLPQLRRLLEQRRIELEERRARGEDFSYRTIQERYFGKSFSLN
jgi:Lon protease-like protein